MALVRKVVFSVRGSNHKIKIGANCVFDFSETRVMVSMANSRFIVGDNTTINGVRFVVSEGCSITIGHDCMFSHAAEIRCGDGHSIIDLSTNARINYPGDVVIGDHVWVGSFARILKGVEIGNNSMLGMQSLITKNVPRNSLAVGVPAKVIKTNITWDRKLIDRLETNDSNPLMAHF